MEAALDIERHKCTSAVMPAPIVSPDTYADEYYLTDAERAVLGREIPIPPHNISNCGENRGIEKCLRH